MKNAFTIILILIALWAIWYFMIRKPSTPAPSQSSSETVTVNETISDDTIQPRIELDHSDEGFMYVPVDASGNVVPQQFATHLLKIAHQGDNCGYQYRNLIIFRVKPKVEETTPTA